MSNATDKLENMKLADERTLDMFCEMADIQPGLVRVKRLVRSASEQLVADDNEATCLDLVRFLSDKDKCAAVHGEEHLFDDVFRSLSARLEKNF